MSLPGHVTIVSTVHNAILFPDIISGHLSRNIWHVRRCASPQQALLRSATTFTGEPASFDMHASNFFFFFTFLLWHTCSDIIKKTRNASCAQNLGREILYKSACFTKTKRTICPMANADARVSIMQKCRDIWTLACSEIAAIYLDNEAYRRSLVVRKCYF